VCWWLGCRWTDWAAQKEEEGEREVGMLPNREEGCFSFFPKSVFILFPNSFAF
jgi:hypothetical protein